MSPEVCRSEPYNWKSDIWAGRLSTVLAMRGLVKNGNGGGGGGGLVLKIGIGPPCQVKVSLRGETERFFLSRVTLPRSAVAGLGLRSLRVRILALGFRRHVAKKLGMNWVFSEPRVILPFRSTDSSCFGFGIYLSAHS